MPLTNLSALDEAEYFNQLYAIIKVRENAVLLAGNQPDSASVRIHNGGNDGNPTFGYGFNLASAGVDAADIEAAITYAYGGSLSSLQQEGLAIVVAWKSGTAIMVNGQSVVLSNADLINLADPSEANPFGEQAQRDAVQSLTLNDAQGTLLLDVVFKNAAGDIYRTETNPDVYGFEAGLDDRLSEEGGVAYSVERVGLMSAYYNAQGLIGAGLQAALGADDRARAWYELRYNHTNFENSTAQTRRAAEAEQVGLVSQAAKDDPAGHINEYARSLSILFNDNDNANIRIYSRIVEPTLNGLTGAAGSRDQHDPLAAAISDELLILGNHFVAPAIGAANALNIDWVQFDSTNGGSTLVAGDAAAAGVIGGKDSSNTVNLILGEAGNDRLEGKGATDYLFGGDGDDILAGDGVGLNASTAGGDVLHGGSGTDAVDYSAEDGTVNPTFEASDIRVGQPTAAGEPTLLVTDTYGKTDTLISIEWLIAPGGGDAIDLTGFTGNIGIDGGGGNDTLTGGAGNDSLFGGEGLDVIAGGDGDDLLGSLHAPTFDYSVLSQPEIFAIFDSEEIFNAGNQDFHLRGGAGADAYLIDFSDAYAETDFAANGILRYYASIGDDAGSSTIFIRHTDSGEIESLGGPVFEIGNNLNYVVTNLGNIYWIGVFGGNEVLKIDDFDLWVKNGGERGEGLLFFSVESGTSGGFANADAANYGLNVSPSGPVLIAGNGVTSSTAGSLTTVTGTSSADVVHAQGGNQLLNLSGGNDIANTGDGDDVLNGEAGADTLSGGEGDDTLDGGAGADSLIGGAGIDYASYSNSTAGVTVDYAAGVFVGDIYSGVEGVIGSSFGDVLTGDATANIFDGAGGNDVVSGGDGADLIVGGSGRDTLLGGLGQDSIDASAGDDSVDGGADADDIFGGAGLDSLVGNNGNDTLSGGTENDTLLGGNGYDYMLGGDSGDSLDGGALNDTLLGGAGNDIMRGGADNDYMLGESGRDQLFGDDGDDNIDAGAGDDTIDGGLGRDGIYGGSDFDSIIGGGGNDTLQGGGEADTLLGGNGLDLLIGDDGDDSLEGGDGDDIISGSAGNDTITFSVSGDQDTLRDFTAGAASEDTIRLVGFGAAFDTFSEVIAAATDNGVNTTIDFGGGDILIIRNVLVSELHADDFSFG